MALLFKQTNASWIVIQYTIHGIPSRDPCSYLWSSMLRSTTHLQPKEIGAGSLIAGVDPQIELGTDDLAGAALNAIF